MVNTTEHEYESTDVEAMITCYSCGVPQSQSISYDAGVVLKDLFSQLAVANAHDPDSSETQRLQQQILEFAEQHCLLPRGFSPERFLTQLDQKSQFSAMRTGDGGVGPLGVGQEFFCNFVATGEGAAFPIIILPRFIPIVMAPIPRLFVGWKTSIGVTSVGGLRSRTGFIASGPQEGIALGFWGIGFSIFLPPIMAYGMFGYALYAKVTAAEMDYWPPNNPPEVTAVYPLDGATYVPLSTSELQFHIGDLDGDLMSYSVTTYPDVGGGNGNLKPDGTYSVPISNLQSYTQYSCHIQVTDGKDTVEKTVTFTTEAVGPVVSDPFPGDNVQYVAVETSELSFDLRDFQGDLMDWSVETQPDVGSGSGAGVGDGRYTVAVSGLDYFTSYTWFVNATDGEHWTRKAFMFQTIAENTMVLVPTDDTSVWENNPDSSNSGFAERMSTRSASGCEGDMLIKFDISAIPSDVTIQYASLQGYYYRKVDGNPSGHQINCYRLTSDWDEGTVTWNTQPSYVADVTSYAIVPSVLNMWMFWDVTEDVQFLYTNGLPCNGWKLLDVSGGYIITSIRSKDYTEYHPLLIIGYEQIMK